MKDVVVLDIDGLILNTEYIFQELLDLGLKGDEKWEYFHKNCNSDKTELMPGALELLQIFYDAGISIVFSTARNEKCKEATEKKLHSYGINFIELYMRKDGDLRLSSEVKKEHLENIMKKYNVTLFIDDDLSNCEMAKNMGISTLRKV